MRQRIRYHIRHIRIALGLVLTIGVGSSLFGQIQVTPGSQAPYTPENLIREVFLGDGVVIQNILFPSDPISTGYFNTGLGDIALDRGLVLTTGSVSNISTQNNSAGTSVAHTLMPPISDPDLEMLAGNIVQDISKYEITFRPLSDTLKFRYVFASEEYPEFSCATDGGSFNDAFGFFLSGPGLAGPFANGAENLALLPDGVTPITITNVNGGDPNDPSCNGMNSEFYNDNPPLDWMMFDGYLTVMEVVQAVQPCEEYTLKIAIGDAGRTAGFGDTGFDSAVFLEEGSFKTNFAQGERNTVNQNGILQEGCNDGGVTVTLPAPLASDLNIIFSTGGDVSASDYSLSSTGSLTIPAGQTEATLVINALEDGTVETDAEDLFIAMQISPCKIDTFFFKIEDNTLVDPDLGEDTAICIGESVQLYPSFVPVVSDERVFTYPGSSITIPDATQLEPGATVVASIDVTGVEPATLGPGVIQSVCVDVTHFWVADVNLFLKAPDGSFIELSTNNGGSGNDYMDACFVDDPTAPLIAEPGMLRPEEPNGDPISGTFRPEGTWSDLWRNDSPTNGTWELLVFDDSNGPNFPAQIRNFEITFNATYEVAYSYMPTTGLSCTDCADPIATPDVTTEYFLTVTDNNGCEKTDSITITVISEIAPPVATCVSNTPNDITVVWDESLGATEYRININNGGFFAPNLTDTSHTVFGLDPGQTIDIGLRPIGPCMTRDTAFQCSVVACDPPVLVLDSIRMPNCNGEASGVIFTTTTTTSGATTFTYVMQPGGQFSSTGDFTGVEAGDYEITVQDNFGCFDVLSVTVTEPDAISTSTSIINEPQCPGLSNAQGSVSEMGGTGPYTYLWSDGSTNGNITGAAAGKYFVTVTDANSCMAVDSLTFTDPPRYNLEVSSTQVSCNGDMDGTAMVVATGGVGTYTYLWDAAADAQTTATSTGLSGGNYIVVVRDANNCIETTNVDVLERDIIQATVLPIDATCDGIDDGEASVTDVLGGAGGFTYLWDDVNATTGEIISNIAVGDYMVTVTDSDNCFVVESVSVQSPPAMTANISITTVSCSGGMDGSASLDVSGGAGNYMYDWGDGGPSTNSRNNLSSNLTMVTVTDDNGCRLIESFTVPSQNPIFVDIDSTVVTCFGGADGTASLMASGGVGTLDIQWDDPTSATTNSISNLSIGIYRVTVTDDNGCFVVDSIEVTQNEQIELETSSTAIDCNGDMDGSATVTVLNGITIDSYQWNDPTTQVTPTAIGLEGGTYKVRVTYNGICLDSIEAVVQEPELLVINIDKTDIACNGETNGSATAVVTGGTGPFMYQWNDANTQITATASGLIAQSYSVMVTDANNCISNEMTTIVEPMPLVFGNIEAGPVICYNEASGRGLITPAGGTAPYSYTWSDGLSTDSLRNDLLPERYYFTITDAGNCTISDSLYVINKMEMLLTPSSTIVTCFGGDDGTARVMAIGGNGGFMYQWNDASNQTGEIANAVMAGTYMVTVTDALGCARDTMVDVPENQQIVIGGDVFDVQCFNESNGMAEANAFGGSGALSYQWDDPLNTTGPILGNLSVGSYLVSVTDALNCLDTLRFTVNQPDTLTLSFSIDGLLCFGDDIGTITVNPTGGNGNFEYQWDDPASQITQAASGLTVGLYSVTVNDSRNCTTIDTIRLIEPETLTLALDSTDVLCNGALTGAINATVGGGTPNYSYNYTGGITTADPSGLAAGDYVLTVTDMNGCVIRDSTTINEPTAVVIESMKTDIDCFGNINGAIDITTSGGIMPYTYNWSSGQNVDDISDLSAGVYLLTVTDGNNCENESSVTITSPPEIMQAINKTDIACFGDATGQATAVVNGGVGGYTYNWSTGDATASITTLTSNTYFVTILDANGCESRDSVMINQPDEALMAISTAIDLVCFGEANGTIDLDVTGGTAPFRYILDDNPISNNSIFQGLSGGTYNIEVIDQNGCTFSLPNIMVFEPAEIVVNLGENLLIELGVDTVQLTPLISGGQGALTYEYSGTNLDNLSCTTCPDPFIQGQVFSKEYTLTVTDQQGCSNADNVLVVISKDRRVWVPTGFTPNSDNANDLLTPLGDPNTTVLNFQIFDRWGTLIWEQNEFQLGDPNFGWDGTFRGQELDNGVFVWKADVIYFEDGIQESFTGQTYLIR